MEAFVYYSGRGGGTFAAMTSQRDSLLPGFASGLPRPSVTITGTVTLDRAVLKRARGGMPWVGSDEVISYDGDNGPFADAIDETGLPVGTVLWDTGSDVRARLLSTTRTRDPVGLLVTRLERALHRRVAEHGEARHAAFRVVHGEADGVPGVYIDRFGDALHADVDSAVLLPLLESIIERTMAQLDTGTLVVRHGRRTERLRGAQSLSRYHSGPLALEVDLESDDVRRLSAELDAVLALRAWARGRVLDAYGNGGAFGLHLADAGASRATVVDNGAAHRQRVLAFANDNGLSEKVEAIDAEPLAWLQQTERTFDLVVCHPPHAYKAPREAEQEAVAIAAAALRTTGEGGIFCARSSSSSLSDERFAAALADAATHQRKRLQVLARVGPGPDHPTLAGTPMAPSLVVMRVLSTG